MVELRGIEKYFPVNGIYALDNAGFELRSAEIHALLGENGAGKSTLMHIMAGYLKPSRGSICINGKEYHFAAPADALAAGIGMVRQHPNLVPGFKVWEDCILGSEGLSGPFINRKKARNQIRSLSERWGFDLPIDRPTDSLSVSLRQKTAILALLLRNVGYLIFDEPTAVLTPGETQGLFTLFAQLKAEGKGIVLISHKLEETLGLADRVTILRKGRTVAVRSAASLDGKNGASGDVRALGNLMFGLEEEEKAGEVSPPIPLPEINALAPSDAPAPSDGREPPLLSPAGLVEASGPSKTGCLAKPCLTVRGLSVELPGRPFIRGVDLEVSPGRILGIAGVRDSGLETLELAITGFLRPTGGTVTVNGRDITGRGPGAFRMAGAAYLGAGISGSAMYAPSLSIRDNVILHAHRRSTHGFPGKLGFMDQAYLDTWIGMVLSQARLSRSPQAGMASFSGGMIQRIILAREWAERAALLVLAEPGQGLDRLSREALLRKLRTYADSGRGILLFSTDTEELAVLSDEIRILRGGIFSTRILSGLSLSDLSRKDSWKNREAPERIREIKNRIGRAMAGGDGHG
ncbi:MAG: ATP-binding cassette domain-containing protein [Spirochaetaceae bacterium]|jgi:simple sugar transport system ATP-binding protein|nr:ATP-binding cassette domain-containing protein [Spirochaetaceae bacterium]